jgi:hypothetical protein
MAGLGDLPFLKEKHPSLWTLLIALHEYKDEDIRDHIVNKLYIFDPYDVEPFLLQLWYVSAHCYKALNFSE